MTPPADDIVGYTVKEILVRLDSKLDVLDAKFDTVDAKLEQKADRARVHDLAATIGIVDTKMQVLDSIVLKKGGPEQMNLDSRLVAVERWQTGAIVLSGWQRWFFGTVCVALVGALATLVWLAAGN
jgi:hypothetical protein